MSPNPIVTAVASPTSICLGDSITLSATGADQYLWSSSDTANTFVIYPTSNQTYSVTGNTLFGCSDIASVSIVVNQPPILNASDTNVCTGNSVDLAVSGAINYLWTPNTGLSADNVNNPTATLTATLTYAIIGTDDNGCSDTTTLEVEVLNDPIPEVFITNNSPVCNGNKVSFSVDSTLHGGSNPQFQWYLSSNNGSTYSAQGTGETISLSDLSGDELVRVHMTSNETCVAPQTIIDTSNISSPTITPFPDLSLFEDLALCPGETGALQVTDSASQVASFSWYHEGQFLQFGDSYPITDPSQSGSYQVVAANEQCSDTSNPISVSYYAPYLELSAEPAHIMGGDPTTLTANTNATSLIWSSDNQSEDMSSYTTSEITVSPTITTTYQVTGTLETCPVSDTVLIQVVSPFVVPYFFSPNADEDNDLWLIDGLSSYPTYVVTIYNRWGSVIRTYDNNFKYWDGANENGKELPDGTYYYVIQWGLGDEDLAMSGHVTITR
jgi:gliding motility-associated-like protein